MSTTETTVQLLNRRDAITSRIATYRQPGRPARQEDLDELGEVMAEINRREIEQSWEMTPEAAERNAKFAAFATAADDVDPALYGLPQDSEIGPEFYPEPALEPSLEGYGALSETEYQVGEAVEVLFPDGWRSGATFTGYRAGGPDEDFLRINVKLAEPGRSAEGCHPDCVRRPFPPAGWDVAEPGPEQHLSCPLCAGPVKPAIGLNPFTGTNKDVAGQERFECDSCGEGRTWTADECEARP